jgi:SAM-dependent methyltransferase
VSSKWTDAVGYESYVGRWSRIIAPSFLQWFAAPAGSRWLDVGCGTGALTNAIIGNAQPVSLNCLDSSEAYLLHATEGLSDERITFDTGDATALPYPDHTFDAVVSGLLLNFVDSDTSVAEQRRVAAVDGLVGAYVWDYGGDYELIRYFWSSAAEVDPTAVQHDPGLRFPLCEPDALSKLFRRHGLRNVRSTRLTANAFFPSFSAYWRTLDVRQGSLAEYLSAIDETTRSSIRARLEQAVPRRPTGELQLKLSAVAVVGTS